MMLLSDKATPGTMDPSQSGSTLAEQWLHLYRMSQPESGDDTAALLSATAFVDSHSATDWLILGMGSGSRAKFVHWATNWHVDFVELYTQVVDVAQQYFEFPPLPHAGPLDANCSYDGRICVMVKDARDQVRALAASGRQYGCSFIDVGGSMFEWDAETWKNFLSPIADMSSVVVLNPAASSNMEPARKVMRQFFNRLLCIPVQDERGCFLLGLTHNALSKDVASARAVALDESVGWSPFSLAAYMQDNPLHDM